MWVQIGDSGVTLPLSAAVGRDALALELEDLPFAARERPQRLGLGPTSQSRSM